MVSLTMFFLLFIQKEMTIHGLFRQEKQQSRKSMNTMTLDELNKLPPLTEAEKQTIRNAKPTPTEDCPAMTAEELKEFRPWYAKNKKPVFA